MWGGAVVPGWSGTAAAAGFCPEWQSRGSAVNHHVLGTGQREREQLLSATLPAIRQPALAHGHGHGHTDTHRRAHTRLQTWPPTLHPGTHTHTPTHTGTRRVLSAPDRRAAGGAGVQAGEPAVPSLPPPAPAAGRAGASPWCSFTTRTQNFEAEQRNPGWYSRVWISFYFFFPSRTIPEKLSSLKDNAVPAAPSQCSKQSLDLQRTVNKIGEREVPALRPTRPCIIR